MSFLRGVLERDNGDIGLFVVRGLGLLVAVTALFVGFFYAKGAGAIICSAVGAIFMLAALFPRPFGKIAGGAILLVAFVVMITGPDGEVGLSSYGFWRSLPLYLLAGLFVRPEITTLAVSLFRPER